MAAGVSGTENELQGKSGDDLWLGSKGKCDIPPMIISCMGAR